MSEPGLCMVAVRRHHHSDMNQLCVIELTPRFNDPGTDETRSRAVLAPVEEIKSRITGIINHHWGAPETVQSLTNRALLRSQQERPNLLRLA